MLCLWGRGRKKVRIEAGKEAKILENPLPQMAHLCRKKTRQKKGEGNSGKALDSLLRTGHYGLNSGRMGGGLLVQIYRNSSKKTKNSSGQKAT